MQTPIPECADDDTLGPVLAWMAEHLDQPITVEELARRAAVSPRTFARRFVAGTGPRRARPAGRASAPTPPPAALNAPWSSSPPRPAARGDHDRAHERRDHGAPTARPLMFRAWCAAEGTEVLLTARRIHAVRRVGDRVEFWFTCWCGHRGHVVDAAGPPRHAGAIVSEQADMASLASA